MAELDRVIESLKTMTLADLSILQSELGKLMRVQALNELEAKERELNDLRALAGFKRKPFKSQRPDTVAATSGDVTKRRGRRSNAEIAAEKAEKEAAEKSAKEDADRLAAKMVEDKAAADKFDAEAEAATSSRKKGSKSVDTVAETTVGE